MLAWAGDALGVTVKTNGWTIELTIVGLIGLIGIVVSVLLNKKYKVVRFSNPWKGIPENPVNPGNLGNHNPGLPGNGKELAEIQKQVALLSQTSESMKKIIDKVNDRFQRVVYKDNCLLKEKLVQQELDHQKEKVDGFMEENRKAHETIEGKVDKILLSVQKGQIP